MKSLLAVLALAIAVPAYAQTDQTEPGVAADHAPARTPPGQTAQGVGEIKAVDAKGGTITLHHGPIAAIGWPAMTMTFHATPEVLAAARPGQRVAFTLAPDQSLVTAITPQPR